MTDRYGNGTALSRGEFIAHMERVDTTLQGIDERLDRIEIHLARPRQAALAIFGTLFGRIFLVLAMAGIAYLATLTGITYLPF